MDKWLLKKSTPNVLQLELRNEGTVEVENNNDKASADQLNFRLNESGSDDEVQESNRNKKLKRLLKRKPSTPKFCDSWLNKEEFQSWLKKSVHNETKKAFCKVCFVDIICYNKNSLTRHSKSSKHIQNLKKPANNHDINNLFQGTPLDRQVKRAELILGATIATKCLSFSLMDTLGPILTKIFPDSKIAKKLTMKRTKTKAVVDSLANVMEKTFVEKLRIPGSFFTLIMDETTDVKNVKQCAFTVIFYDEENDKLLTNFFDIIETDGSNAESLYNLLEKVIVEKNIPLENLIGFSSDTANVMAGERKSVFALLKQKLPHIVTIKCSCHMIHLVASKACLKLSNSAEDLLRNLGSYFHRSWKRIKELEKIQEFFSVDIHRILSPSTTRWLSMKHCVDRVLEQYAPLKAYLQSQLNKDPSPTLKSMLNTMENRFTLITLQFLSYVLEIFTSYNLMFQTEKPVLHKVKPELEKIMRDICSNYIDIAYIRKNDIFNVSHNNPRLFVSLDKLYIGLEANESLNELMKNKKVPVSEINEFQTMILNFYIESITQIKLRFDFSDPIFTFLCVLEPKEARKYEMKTLSPILKRFPVLEKYIGLQDLDNEWKRHALLNLDDYDIKTDLEADIYWGKIFNIKNAAGEPIFKNLKRVINLLLTLPFSNTSVERVFSSLKNIKTDHRNNLSTNTLKSILTTKTFITHQGNVIDFEPSEEMLKTKIWEQ